MEEIQACYRGHPLTPENTSITADGRQRCRTCRADNQRQWRKNKNGPPKTSHPADFSWIDADDFLSAYDNRLSATAWRDRAACRVEFPNAAWTNKWFAKRGLNSGLEGMRICKQCDVRIECLAYGIWEPVGTWGGLSERGRRRIRKRFAIKRETTETWVSIEA